VTVELAETALETEAGEALQLLLSLAS